jgi:hypothetical protein
MATINYTAQVNFGSAKSGYAVSSGIGYTVYDFTGAVIVAYTTSGVSELVAGSGIYYANTTISTLWNLPCQIVWSIPAISAYASDTITTKEILYSSIASLVWGALLTTYNAASTFGAWVNGLVGSILVSPTQPIATNSSGYVIASSVQGNLTGSVGSVTSNITVGGYATGQDPASKVWGAALSVFNGSGTFGAFFNALIASVKSAILKNPSNPIAADSNGSIAVNNLPTDYLSNSDHTAIVVDVQSGLTNQGFLSGGIANMNLSQIIVTVGGTSITLEQCLKSAYVNLNGKKSVIGSTEAIYDIDKATLAVQFALDNATNPTTLTPTQVI